MSSSPERLAVLIDADDTSPKYVRALLDELASYGTATVKRAYGDWTTPQLGGWKRELNQHAIVPCSSLPIRRARTRRTQR